MKLWNTSSGFCFITFTEHSSAVTTVTFNASGKVVMSASLDGTVRAFDLHRCSTHTLTPSHPHSLTASQPHSIASHSHTLTPSLPHILMCPPPSPAHSHVAHRYRNFRTFASPRPTQFVCLTLDPSGEVVCAGSHDTFEIFVWSVQTGRLLEVCSVVMS